MTAKIEPKTYLGNGLYCEDEGDLLHVYASLDGKKVMEALYFVPDTLQALVTFARYRGYVIK